MYFHTSSFSFIEYYLQTFPFAFFSLTERIYMEKKYVKLIRTCSTIYWVNIFHEKQTKFLFSLLQAGKSLVFNQ